MRGALALVGVAGMLTGCAAPASHPATPSRDAAALLAAVSSLAGDWDGVHDGRPVTTRFEPSSGGTAVRELLHAGTPEEMTNVYHLDGDSLLVTSWQGSAIFRGKLGGKFEVAMGGLKGSADIAYDSKRKRLVVPRFMDNAVEVYDLP